MPDEEKNQFGEFSDFESENTNLSRLYVPPINNHYPFKQIMTLFVCQHYILFI